MYLDFPPLYVLDNGSQLQVEWLAQADHYLGLVPGPDNINLAACLLFYPDSSDPTTT